MDEVIIPQLCMCSLHECRQNCLSVATQIASKYQWESKAVRVGPEKQARGVWGDEVAESLWSPSHGDELGRHHPCTPTWWFKWLTPQGSRNR